MNLWKFTPAMVFVVATASIASAQQNQLQLPTNPERPRGVINDVTEARIAMHPVTPFVEASTVALVKIDLARLDLDANLRAIDAMGESNEGVRSFMRGTVESLRRAGVDAFYLVAGTRSVTDGGPLVVIPCEDTTAVRNLAEAMISQLPNRGQLKSHEGKEVVLAGPQAAIDRVLNAESVLRPRLLLPLTQQSDYHHLAVISLPEEYRHELKALWPEQLPKSFPVKVSPQQLANDLLVIDVSWKMLPEPDVEVKFVGSSQAAVERLRKTVVEVLAVVPAVAETVEVTTTPDSVVLRSRADQLQAVIATIVLPARRRAEVLRVSNSLKQVGIAFHNYASANRHVVPRHLTDPEGNPLYSWRVALLPYLEQQALYENFKRDQSWDSPANQQVSSTRIPTFTEDASLGNKTTFRAPVYPGSLWHGDGPPRRFRDVIDGSSNTVMFIDAPRDAAIEWARPEPWVLSDDLMNDIFGDRQRAHVAMMDGSVIVLEKSEMTNEKLKALLTIAGGETIESLR